jgi:ATP-dependent phosphoenolpyruvate carboxykinase
MKVIAFSGYSERVAGSEQGLFDAHPLEGAGFDQPKELLE